MKNDYLGLSEKVTYNKINVRSNSETKLEKKKGKYKINENYYRNKFKVDVDSENSSEVDEFIPKREFDMVKRKDKPN